jgi:hypothetical protein
MQDEMARAIASSAIAQNGHNSSVPHRRDQIEGLSVRADISGLIIRLLKLTAHYRFPGHRFAAVLPLIVAYFAALQFYGQGKVPKASDLCRIMDCPHETMRRYLSELVRLKLMTKEGTRYRPRPDTVGRIKGVKETAAAIRRAAAVLEAMPFLGDE